MLRAACLAAALALTAAIVWAFQTAVFSASFGAMIRDPWGVVTLIDLYGGFLFACIVMAHLEPDRRISIPAIALTPFLGNIVPLVWMGTRGLRLLGSMNGRS
jgi:hypothetical protein